MKSSTTRVQIVGVLAVAGWAASTAAELPRYEVRWVPPAFTYLGRPNDRGEVVGSRWIDNDRSAAFRWSDGVLTDLPSLPGSTRAGASAINNYGEIVGTLSNDSGRSRAVRWRNGQIIELQASGSNAVVHDINDDGTAVGSTWTDTTGPSEAVVWADTAGVSLPAVGGENAAAAWRINNRGQILGGFGPSAAPVVIWTDGVGQRLVPTDQGIIGFNGAGLNNRGQAAVGLWLGDDFLDPDQRWAALLFSGGTATDLGTLGPPTLVPGTYASGINDQGVVVGSSGGRAFIWQNGVMTDFQTLVDGADGIEIWSLRSINNQGWIVATAHIDNVQRDILLAPVPAPGTAAFFALGVLALARRRR